MAQPSDPQTFNRFSYSYNNPINFTDPSGHVAEPSNTDSCGPDGIYCGIGLDNEPAITGSNAPPPISPQDLIWIYLIVFAEASNGTHSDEAQIMMAWTWFNKNHKNLFANMQSSSGAWAGIIEAYKQPGDTAEQSLMRAYNCYTSEGCSPKHGRNFLHTRDLVNKAYGNYISGGTDPTRGSTMFSHQDKNIAGQPFDTIDDAREYLRQNYLRMEPRYTPVMARNDLTVWPFRWALSQPYWSPIDEKWLVLSVGTHPCAAVASCGAGMTPR